MYWRCMGGCDEDYCNQCLYEKLPVVKNSIIQPSGGQFNFNRRIRNDSIDSLDEEPMMMRMTISESMSYEEPDQAQVSIETLTKNSNI